MLLAVRVVELGDRRGQLGITSRNLRTIIARKPLCPVVNAVENGHSAVPSRKHALSEPKATNWHGLEQSFCRK